MDGGMGGMTVAPAMPGMDVGGGKMESMMHMTFFSGTHVDILFSGWPGDRGVGMYALGLLFVLAASALLESLVALSRRLSRSPASSGAIVLTAVHGVRMGLAYLVMLAVMSFNAGVLIAAVGGHALGFLVFGSWICKLPRGNRTNNLEAVPSTK